MKRRCSGVAVRSVAARGDGYDQTCFSEVIPDSRQYRSIPGMFFDNSLERGHDCHRRLLPPARRNVLTFLSSANGGRANSAVARGHSPEQDSDAPIAIWNGWIRVSRPMRPEPRALRGEPHQSARQVLGHRTDEVRMSPLRQASSPTRRWPLRRLRKLPKLEGRQVPLSRDDGVRG